MLQYSDLNASNFYIQFNYEKINIPQSYFLI